MTAEPPEGYTRVDRAPFVNFVGPLYQAIAPPPGRVRLGLRVTGHHVNTMGGLHGGMAATMADSAMARALVFQLNRKAVTMRLSVDYVDSVREGDWVDVEAWVAAEDGEFGHTACEISVGGEVRMRGEAVFRILRRAATPA